MRTDCKTCGAPVQKAGRVLFDLDPASGRLTHTCPKERTMSIWDQPGLLPEPLGDMEVVERDRFGRPLITPPGESKAVGYQRVTTFIKLMDDTAGLDKWKQRQVAIGLSMREDLRKAVESLAPGCAEDDAQDKKALSEVCQQAMDAAGSSSRATIGTALHRITERLDRGQQMPLPDWAEADVAAYRRATANIEWVHIERMMVNDDLRVAGTPDRIGVLDRFLTIVDLKTGSSLWPSSHAMQLGVYANSLLYDLRTKERTDPGVRKDKGLIIHVPAGTGRAELVWVDIAAGWEAAQLAAKVRDWRKRKDLSSAYVPEPVDFAALAAGAADLPSLYALHAQAVEAGAWDDTLKAVFGARKAELTAAA